MSFGSNLSNLRKSRGLSQEEFGEAVGVSRQTIYTWEGDISSPNIENLKTMASYFGCSVDDLINGTAADLENAEGTEGERLTCTGNKAEITSFINRFALQIATGVLLILVGVAAMIGLSAVSEIGGLAAFFLCLIAAVFLFIYSGITHDSFMSKPQNQNHNLLYSSEEKATENHRFAIALASAVGGILADVLLLCVLYATIVPESNSLPVAIFMTVMAVCVFVIVNYSIRLTKFESDAPKNESKTASVIHSILWMVTVAAYLVLGFCFDMWHPGWIVFVIAGFISGIVGTIFESKPENK